MSLFSKIVFHKLILDNGYLATLCGLINYRFLFCFVSFFFKFYFIFKLNIIVLVLPNIKMNPPQAYTCSPS